MANKHSVIKRPIISEKSTALMEVAGRYVFEVDAAATKFQVRDAVQDLFKVEVAKVRTLRVPGKLKRAGRLIKKTPTWKKAIITLQPGQKIELFGAGNA